MKIWKNNVSNPAQQKKGERNQDLVVSTAVLESIMAWGREMLNVSAW